jgi:hypothetical protein
MKLAWCTAMLASGALSACGGGNDSSQPASAPASTQTTATTTDTTATTTTEATATEPAAASGVTKPGTTLKQGDTAHVVLTPLGQGLDSKNRFNVDATVVSISKGKKADFNNINLDAKQKASAAYYVKVKVTNTGRKLPAKEDPDVRFDGIDDRGQEQNNIIFIGGFDACEDADPPKSFSKGASYESCLVYLIPGGGSITEVQWKGADEYYSKPVVWK